MTHVLMTADAVGGVWTYAVDLVDALAEHDVTVSLAVMGGALDDSQRARARRVGARRIHESDFALEWMDDPWHAVDAAGRWLLELEAEEAPDVVHLNGYTHASLPWHAPSLVVAHSCVLSWWSAVHGVRAPHSYAEYERRVRAGLIAADAIVAPTRAMLHELGRCYGVQRGSVIYNSCADPMAAGRSTAIVKEPFVLGVGRIWDGAKNLAAVAAIADDLSWPVVFVGEDRAPGHGNRSCFPSVTMLGRISHTEVAQWQARASILAAPARYEPFGLGILEAARQGCALVLGDIASLRELWSDAAVFVHPDDHAAIRAALAGLIDDSAARAALAVAARERAHAYGRQRMVAGYLQQYDALCSEMAS